MSHSKDKKECEKKSKGKGSTSKGVGSAVPKRASRSSSASSLSTFFGSMSSVSPAPLTSDESVLSVRTSSSSLGASSENNLVRLNIYGLTKTNKFLSWAGLGIYHSGVQVFGAEWAFGGYPKPVPSIFRMKKPRDLASLSDIVGRFHFKESIEMGRTKFTYEQVKGILIEFGAKKGWIGTNYHLVQRNCNHFADVLIGKLCGEQSHIPSWINRMATILSQFPFILEWLPKEYLTPRALAQELKTSTESKENMGARIASQSKQLTVDREGGGQTKTKQVAAITKVTTAAKANFNPKMPNEHSKSTLSSCTRSQDGNLTNRHLIKSDESLALGKENVVYEESVLSVENSFVDETDPSGTEPEKEQTVKECLANNQENEELESPVSEKEKEGTEKDA